MGCGKRALCRKQQAPPIALVWCKSPLKECSRPSLSRRSSSLPKHLRNVGKEEKMSTEGPPRISSFRRKSDLCHQGNTEKRGVRYPLVVSQAAKHELCTQSAVLWVSLTWSIDMDTKKDPNESLELASWCGHTLLQSEHDVLRSAHAENKDHLCLYTIVAKIK